MKLSHLAPLGMLAIALATSVVVSAQGPRPATHTGPWSNTALDRKSVV